MRIGFVSTEFPPAFGSGLAAYTSAAAQAWAAAGHEVHVIAPVSERETRDGVTLHPFALPSIADEPLTQGLRAYGEHYERAFLMQERLDAFVRETAVDILEFQDARGLAYFYLLRRGWQAEVNQVPVVVRLQDSSINAFLGDGVPHHSLGRYVDTLLEDGVARMADAWLAPSSAIVQETQRRLHVARPRAIVAPFPLVPASSDAAARDREIVFVGQLRRANGVEVLVDALRGVLPGQPGWRVRFVGADWTDPLRGRSMREWIVSRLGEWQGRVSFDGLQQPEHVRAKLLRSAIVVAPPVVSSVAYAACEALASGAVLVASEAAAASDFVRGGVPGFVCRTADASDLARALTSAMALTQDERDSLGARARAEMARLASPECFVSTVSRAYAQLRRRPRRVAVPTPPALSARPRRASRAPRTCALIVPCFNMGDTVTETLESVLASTRVPDEIIVVDDGSTDPATRDVLDRWSPRVRVVRTENRGLSGARNAGAAASSADTLAFLDADDIISPGFFAAAMTSLQRHAEAGFVTPWVQVFGAGHAVFSPPAPHFPLQLVRNLSVCFALIRREAFDDAGGFKPQMRFGYEDWEFWIGVLEAGWSGLSIPERMFHYRWRERSMLRTMTEPAKFALMEQLIAHHPSAYRTHHADTRLLEMQQQVDGRDALRAVVDAVSVAGHRAVTVYGAGEWGRFLRTELVRRGIDVRRFVDGNTRMQGLLVDTLPVAPLAEAVASGDRVFVIGSLSFAPAIAATINEHCQAIGVEPVIFS